MKNVIALMVCLNVLAASVRAEPALIIVQGAAGEPEYGKQFAQWRAHWEEAGKKGGAQVVVIGAGDEGAAREDEAGQDDAAAAKSDLAHLRTAIVAQLTGPSRDPVWIVLLGHGTFDGKVARFNLNGPDVSADELAQWLAPIERPVAIINCSSSSGPFIAALAGKDRVIITAARSGNEMNFSRFGGFLSLAIADAAADLDKDGQTSLLEAYLLASRRTQEWYKEEGRLATEHALLEDSGDGLGTPADWFRGVHAVKQAKEGAAVDGVRAGQWCLVPSAQDRRLSPELRTRRDELEQKIAKLREVKSSMPQQEYYDALEGLLVQLARWSATHE